MKSTASLGGKLGTVGKMPSLASFGKNLGKGALTTFNVAKTMVGRKTYDIPKPEKQKEPEYKGVDLVKRTDYLKLAIRSVSEQPAYGNVVPIDSYRNIPQSRPQVYMTAGVVGYSPQAGSYAPAQSAGYAPSQSAGYARNVVELKPYKQGKAA